MEDADAGGQEPGEGDERGGWDAVWRPLPEGLFSEETGEPFEKCIDCGQHLDERGLPYMIQKCSNGRETIFEFAICIACAERLHSTYSDDSRKALERFFLFRANPQQRTHALFEKHGEPSLEEWTANCMTCERGSREGESFSLAALCDGKGVLFGHAPFLICHECETQMNMLISSETRGEWDRFVGQNFDLPPADVHSPDRPQIVLIG